MKDCLDIIQLLNKVPQRKCRNMEIYGIAIRELSNPEYMVNASTQIHSNCKCVELKLYGIGFKDNDNIVQSLFDYSSTDNRYFIRGSMIAYVDKSMPMNDWCSVRGTISIPRGYKTVVNLLTFKRGSNGGWLVVPSQHDDIVVDSWDKQGRLYTYLMQGVRTNSFIQPDDIKSLGASTISEGVVPSQILVNDINTDNKISDTIENQNSQEIKKGFEKIEDNIEKGVCSLDNLVMEDRFKPLSRSKLYEDIDDSVSVALDLSSEYLDAVGKKYYYSADEDNAGDTITDEFLERIKQYWSSKATSLSSTGFAITKAYIEGMGVDLNRDYLGSTLGNYFKGLGSSLIEYSEGLDITITGDAKKVCDRLFKSRLMLYAGLMAVILGKDIKKFVDTATRCEKLDLDFPVILTSNPYLLILITNCFTFKEIEDIAVSIGVANKQELKRAKNIGILYDYTLNSEIGDTFYDINSLKNLGFTITKNQYDTIKTEGTYLTAKRISNVRVYINRDLKDSDISYPLEGWYQVGLNMVQRLSTSELKVAIRDFLKSGLGIRIKVNNVDNRATYWLGNTKTVEKELYVYNKILELSNREIGIDEGEINSAIEEFESEQGFKLEEKQRLAVELTKCGIGVVTGGAGSGKTTVSRAMVYALRKHNPDIKIQFAAPTGKAAKRLQEVVGENVRTMHSLFGILGGQNKGVFDEDDDGSQEHVDVYFFDESAMATLDLLYAVLKKVPSTSQIFFLGHTAQLPPIGKGLPFRDFLYFAPSVHLTVTKRSTGKIAYNSNVIDKFSELSNWKPLEVGDDFQMLPCDDMSIANRIYDLCAYHLGKTDKKPSTACKYVTSNPDDIQVITPVRVKYGWSSTKLNERIRDLFVPKELGKYFIYSTSFTQTEFRLGDRVLHTENINDIQHYSEWRNGNLIKRDTCGLANGDMGKIVGVLPSVECKFTDCPNSSDDTRITPRNDAEDKGDKLYYVVVEYNDFERDEKFYALYHAKLDSSSTYNEMVLRGHDLKCLQLAYALTVHKMQGSQNKHIIFALGNLRRKGFITRNMVYTGISRAEDTCEVVGSVGNDMSSALSSARRVLANSNTNTVTSVLLSIK